MDPRQTGLAPSFLSTRFCILEAAVFATRGGRASSARSQLDPVQLFNRPKSSEMKE